MWVEVFPGVSKYLLHYCELKIYNYIAASLLSHALFFTFIALFLSEVQPEIPGPVLDIDIVGALLEKEAVPQTAEIPPTLKPSLSREPDEDVSRPETMFGEDSSPGGSGQGMEDTADGTGSEEKEQVLPYSFLFDNEIIKKYARKGRSDKKDLTFDVPEFHHRGYMRMLKSRIEGIWKYPEEAARRGISGDLFIRFSINRDGSLGTVELLRTSGHPDLDYAALMAIKDAEPYWPLPEDWEGDDLSITGHFIYVFGKYFIL
jgi:protein TonB